MFGCGIFSAFHINHRYQRFTGQECLFLYGDEIKISTGCPKKNVVSWKNSHNYPQTHPKYKSWGCFGKFRIFATRWALRFSKLKKKTEKMKPHVANPPSKMSRIHCKFWMSLRVVMAIFRRKDIFLGHPV